MYNFLEVERCIDERKQDTSVLVIPDHEKLFEYIKHLKCCKHKYGVG